MRNLKKALSLALASVMVMGMTVVGSNAAFADVDTYDHKEAIDVMQLIDVMVGDQNGNFNPDQKVTRNEMAVVIAKLMNLPLGGNHPFKDVPAWADEYVGALYSHGITGGTSATTYGGSRNITAKEAGLMMMKALGYFTFQGEYGDDWALATVRQANQINLFKDMGVYVDQQLTRNDVAQLALNTLKSDVVVTKELGGLDVSGNGIVVNQKPFYKHELVLESEDYAGRIDGYQQLVEKLYGSDLKLNEANTTDEFGRPASKWTYKSVNSVVSPKAADKVYTAPVKYKDIASDLNATAFAGMKVNGAATAIPSDRNEKAGHDGDVIEAYLNDKGQMTVVVVSTYYGEVRKIENDGKDSRAIKIGGKTFKTDAFSVGDKVLYTVANGEIQNVALVGAMKTGTVTKIVGDDLYIDGVKVLKNHAATDIESVEAGDKVEYYVDGNGYIVKMDITEDMISLDKVGFVNKAIPRSGFENDTAKVELIMSNGTKKVLEVENKYNSGDKGVYDENGNGINLVNRLVAISEKNGEYTLKLATNAVDSFANSANWKNSNATFNGKTVDDNTLFVYAITDAKKNVSYESYKGYRNALGIEDTTDTAGESNANSVPQFTYKLNRDGVVELVYVAAYTGDLDRSNSIENWIFIKADGDEGMTVMPDNTTYYEYKAVVDGKATTIKMDLTTGLTGNTFGNTYHVDKDGMTEEVNLDKAFEQKNVNDKNHAVKYEYKNGVVILTEENSTKTVLAPSKDITVIEVDGDELNVTTLDALRGGYEVYKSFDWVVKTDNSQVQVLVATIK